MSSILIKNATIINEGRTFRGDLLIKDELIVSIGSPDQSEIRQDTKIIDATSKTRKVSYGIQTKINVAKKIFNCRRN